MGDLEAEVEEILRRLEREKRHSFEILPQHNLEGASGQRRKVDFVIKDFNEVKYLVECKDVRSQNIQTFQTQMCRAYTELCDLLLKLNSVDVKQYNFSHPRVQGIIVVRDIPYISRRFDADEFDKWADLFHPISTQLYTLDMFRDMGLDDIVGG